MYPSSNRSQTLIQYSITSPKLDENEKYSGCHHLTPNIQMVTFSGFLKMATCIEGDKMECCRIWQSAMGPISSSTSTTPACLFQNKLGVCYSLNKWVKLCITPKDPVGSAVWAKWGVKGQNSMGERVDWGWEGGGISWRCATHIIFPFPNLL